MNLGRTSGVVFLSPMGYCEIEIRIREDDSACIFRDFFPKLLDVATDIQFMRQGWCAT